MVTILDNRPKPRGSASRKRLDNCSTKAETPYWRATDGRTVWSTAMEVSDMADVLSRPLHTTLANKPIKSATKKDEKDGSSVCGPYYRIYRVGMSSEGSQEHGGREVGTCNHENQVLRDVPNRALRSNDQNPFTSPFSNPSTINHELTYCSNVASTAEPLFCTMGDYSDQKKQQHQIEFLTEQLRLKESELRSAKIRLNSGKMRQNSLAAEVLNQLKERETACITPNLLGSDQRNPPPLERSIKSGLSHSIISMVEDLEYNTSKYITCKRIEIQRSPFDATSQPQNIPTPHLHSMCEGGTDCMHGEIHHLDANNEFHYKTNIDLPGRKLFCECACAMKILSIHGEGCDKSQQEQERKIEMQDGSLMESQKRSVCMDQKKCKDRNKQEEIKGDEVLEKNNTCLSEDKLELKNVVQDLTHLKSFDDGSECTGLENKATLAFERKEALLKHSHQDEIKKILEKFDEERQDFAKKLHSLEEFYQEQFVEKDKFIDVMRQDFITQKDALARTHLSEVTAATLKKINSPTLKNAGLSLFETSERLLRELRVTQNSLMLSEARVKQLEQRVQRRDRKIQLLSASHKAKNPRSAINVYDNTVNLRRQNVLTNAEPKVITRSCTTSMLRNSRVRTNQSRLIQSQASLTDRQNMSSKREKRQAVDVLARAAKRVR